MIRADLHLHSIYSDGAFSPEEVVRRAAEAGVGLCSVTDHDSLEGGEEKRAAAKRYGVLYVNGWEVSSYRGCKVHVLGYNCEAGEAYRAFLRRRRTGAVLRAQDSIGKANAYFGLHVTMEEVERLHLKKNAPLHTMHVVRAFSQKLGCELGKLYAEAFDKGRPAYSDLYRPSPEEALQVIRECGGIAVLAHPGRIDLPAEERLALMNGLAERGLDGIECYHSLHTESETAYFKAYAREKGLLVTGGSDFHADGTVRVAGLPEFYADDELISALRLPS